LKIIAGLKLNDETSHIQKLQLCIALARGVLDLSPASSVNVFLGTSQRFRAKSAIKGRFERLDMRATHAARESMSRVRKSFVSCQVQERFFPHRKA